VSDHRAAEAGPAVLLLSGEPCRYEYRVIRTAHILGAQGLSVTVVCRQAPGAPDHERRDGVEYVRIPLCLSGPSGPLRDRGITAVLNRAYEIEAYYANARGIVDHVAPAAVHVFGLVPLLAGTRIARERNLPLIYDSPELEMDRAARYAKPLLWYRRYRESQFIGRADAVLTASDSIAETLSARYGIADIRVLPNAPIDDGEAAETTVRRRLDLAPETPLGVYVGAIRPWRGLELIIEALAHAPNVHVAAVGPRQEASTAALSALAVRRRVNQRLHFLDPVDPATLPGFVGDADFGFCLSEDICLSYRLSLPNKLFQYAFAGLPAIVSDLPEMAAFVERWGCGAVLRERSGESLGALMTRLGGAGGAGGRMPPETVRQIRDRFGLRPQTETLVEIYRRLGIPDARG